MRDQQIRDALIARNNKVTQEFFYGDCKPLFLSIIRKVFSYPVDYDEFVNEFYVYLMENDSYRLRQFEGRSSIYQWMKVIAIRYFILKRNKMIDDTSCDPLIDMAAQTIAIDDENKIGAKLDINHMLKLMPNKRYAYVIQRLILDGEESVKVAEELRTNVDNLYNIKRRAITALTEIALN